MAVKLYLLFCSNCSYKKLTDGSDLANLTEVKTCRDCGGSRKFKCPKCGYVIRVSKAVQVVEDESQKAVKALREKQAQIKKNQKKALRKISEDDNGENNDDDVKGVL